jgi:hypothetical protein
MLLKVAGRNGLEPITQPKKSELLFPVDPWFWESQKYENPQKDYDGLISLPLGRNQEPLKIPCQPYDWNLKL